MPPTKRKRIDRNPAEVDVYGVLGVDAPDGLEVEEAPEPVPRWNLLVALESLIRNYDRANDEGLWVAHELATLLLGVQHRLGLSRSHAARIIDKICTRTLSLHRTTGTPKDAVLSAVIDELAPFFPALHARLIDPAVKKALKTAVVTYGKDTSAMERAEAIAIALALIKPTWKTSINNVRVGLGRAKAVKE